MDFVNIKATISYDGTSFYGFQIQNSKRTVAGELQKALNGFNISSKVIGSGRTDRGVHALNQVVNFELPIYLKDDTKIKFMLNNALKKIDSGDIYIKKIERVDSSFHARFSAKKRSYRYIIKEGDENPFLKRFVHFEKKIDFELLKKSVKIFEGRFDFAFFMKSGGDEKSTIREIKKACFYRFRNFYIFYFEADAFLRSQIRLIVGSLIALNREEIEIKNILSQLNKEEIFFKKPIKPNGLYLSKIYY